MLTRLQSASYKTFDVICACVLYMLYSYLSRFAVTLDCHACLTPRACVCVCVCAYMHDQKRTTARCVYVGMYDVCLWVSSPPCHTSSPPVTSVCLFVSSGSKVQYTGTGQYVCVLSMATVTVSRRPRRTSSRWRPRRSAPRPWTPR
jgi:hypothetical protein